ncbi:S100P-binding protein-like [Periophthalmus magnuspinnatus]|uniref:S100P-binding protein-like n=1 Tax=Periophthalmus magnuspinnatus TaxID=409849 RepID=UPI002436B126|nr:S100P-binding protein-like [Periophthalmus magnuspinnatus]
MSDRSYINLKIQINNDCTPEPTPKRFKCTSPDEGCFLAEESRRRSSVPFDKDVDSLLCLQDRGDDGYFSLSFEADDVQSPEDLKLGPPLFESSALCGVEESLNHSEWESTLPLQVQVKSVVVPVVPAVSVAPVEGAVRPQLAREEEEKRKYISAVTRHMNEQPSTQDVMGELLSLVSEVARDSRAPHWQHPSDLTRRNYVKRFKPTPVALEEYEKSLDFTFKRFSTIPKLFKRCT